MNTKQLINNVLLEDQQYTLKGLTSLFISKSGDLKTTRFIDNNILDTELRDYALFWIMDELNLKETNVSTIHAGTRSIMISINKETRMANCSLDIELYISSARNAARDPYYISVWGTISDMEGSILRSIDFFGHLPSVNNNYIRDEMLQQYRYHVVNFNNKLINLRDRRLHGYNIENPLSEAKLKFAMVRDIMASLGILK